MARDWQIGDLIQNRWQVYDVKRGGMGIVYIVYDHEWREALAAKTFQDEIFARSPAIAHRFTQEALSWINLDVHQSIAQARFVQTIGGKPYLFLEYVSGGDLGGWIGTLRLTEDLPQVLRFAIHFCDGMTHVLSKGIKAHRDIKPQNCLITQDGTLKVTDFGLAKVFDDVASADRNEPVPSVHGLSIGLSRTGRAVGTCTHMAPEQFDDAKHVDVRADIYSFAVMLFQMLTGQLPFAARTWEDFEDLHKRRLPPSLPNHLLRPNQLLSTVVRACLAKKPVDRPQSFEEVRGSLAEVYESLTGREAPRAAVGAVLSALQLNNKGFSLGKLGRPEEALACYDRAIKLNPDVAVAWNNKANTLDELGRPNEALRCLDHAIKVDPAYANAWYNKGETLRRLHQLEESLSCYRHALELNPLFAEAWNSQGAVLDRLDRQSEARVCFYRSVQVNPGHEKAWLNLSIAETNEGRLEGALACYERVLQLNSRSRDAWLGKAQILGRLDQHQKVIECCNDALEIDPRFAEAWFNEGVALAMLGRLEEAIICHDRAIECDPLPVLAWLSKGEIMSQLSRREEALACYDKAIKLNPHYPIAWFNKGIELVNGCRRYSEALECFEEAARLGYSEAAQAIALCRRHVNEK